MKPLSLGKVIFHSKHFTLHSPFAGCYLLQYKSRIVMGSAIFRFQESYESPKFRNKIFSREEYKTWWRQKRTSRFTYPTYFSGYNIRGEVFLPFTSGLFDPLHPLEQEILTAVARIPESEFYIIATAKGDTGTLRHEMCHALYALNPYYRKSVNRLLGANYRLMPQLFRSLKEIGYAKDVYRDEVNAYLASEGPESLTWAHPNEIDNEQFEKLTTKLADLFSKCLL